MKPIAKIDCNINGKFYVKGDEVLVETKEQLIKLNKIGFIEPLTIKDIQDFGKKEIKIEKPIKIEKKKSEKEE